MFKNLLCYHVPKFAMTAADLEAKLAERPLTPPMGLSLSSCGWLPVGPEGQLVFGFDKHLVFLFAREDKLLPGAAVKREVEQRAKAIEAEKGFKPGRKLLREIKEQVITELLPKVLTKLSTTPVWIDLEARQLMVDAGSTKKAEDAISVLRDVLESLEAVPVVVRHSPMSSMTAWLHGSAPDPFKLGSSLELVLPGEPKTKVKFSAHPIEGCPEVASHLSKGMAASKIELELREDAVFSVNEKLQIKGIKILSETADDGDSADPASAFEAGLRVSIGNCREIIDGLVTAFGGAEEPHVPEEEAEDQDSGFVEEAEEDAVAD